jgi:hypothetical protein
VFTLPILEKYDVDYFECSACGCLETDVPFWLHEAYAIPGVHIDVGQAARVIQTWVRVCFFLNQIDFDASRQCIDYGGSAGLLTRLMRDSGYDFFAFDTYDASKYANYFTVDSLDAVRPALITAFEVFEHFPEPAKALGEIFDTGTDLVIFLTQLYEGQGPSWDYLVPYCGQHIFFYRESALRAVADVQGYELIRSADFLVFVRRNGPYLEAVRKHSNDILPALFSGDLANRVNFGTEHTQRDFEYAKQRFLRERQSSK